MAQPVPPQPQVPQAPVYPPPLVSPPPVAEPVQQQPAPAPEPVSPDAPVQQIEQAQPLVRSASNESPQLPAGAAAAAARAHAQFGHLITVMQAAQADIERWVPGSLLTAATAEAAALRRSVT